jgi:hypothetical protein
MNSMRIDGSDWRATGPIADGSMGTSRQPITRWPWWTTAFSMTASMRRRRPGSGEKKHMATA